MSFAAIRARASVEDTDAVVAACAAMAQKHGVFLQLLDPAIVYSQRHLESAWMHAERARREDRMTARTVEAEFLMYLTGQRQVSLALPLAGIRAGMDAVLVCAAGERAATAIWGLLDKLGWSRDPQGIAVNPGAIGRLGCNTSNAEPEDAVLELVAMVDLVK
jgi:KEOPS complex subunit Cgi121